MELINHVPTGNDRQIYINPERDVPAEAQAVHGITTEFLKDKPVFAEIAPDFMDYVADATLVIHNAEFDLKFLNYELKPYGYKPYKMSDVIDTLQMARQKFPGSPANLDALCRRFGIDNSERDYHGALLDSQLLAEVYLELLGGRQHNMLLSDNDTSVSSGDDKNGQTTSKAKVERKLIPARDFAIPEDELAAHKEMLKQLKDPLWEKMSGSED